MTQAKKFTMIVPPDRVVRLPDDVPTGPVLVTVERDAAKDTDTATDTRRGEGMFEGVMSVDDAALFEPLPPEIQRYFDGESDPEDGLD